ncbi:metallophosphoesterase, partial [Candidatus Peregrinibacteria bacterium]|nr:metallophosphoesterase [Candidatus Peregrinibacteria bacterium]
DLINDPSEAELKEIFKPLAHLGAPVYAVTGNHDAQKPGYYVSERVREELQAVGVKAMDNLHEEVEVQGVKINLLGMSDLIEGEHDWSVLWQKRDRKHFNLLLAHNPDATVDIVPGTPVDLVLSGHTHAGQIKLPPISNWLIPTKHKFVRGWYQVNGRPVYVSSGLGEVILPMRFLIPPEIVVMDILI